MGVREGLPDLGNPVLFIFSFRFRDFRLGLWSPFEFGMVDVSWATDAYGGLFEIAEDDKEGGTQ